MRVRTGGAWKEVASGRVYVGGAWKQLKEARYYDGSAWVTIATFIPELSLSVPSNEVVTRLGAGTATTVDVTATPTGGQAPYTYSWARIVAGSSVSLSPNSATTKFARYLGNGDEVSETHRCTCTDAFGTTATGDIAVSFNSTFVGGGG